MGGLWIFVIGTLLLTVNCQTKSSLNDLVQNLLKNQDTNSAVRPSQNGEPIQIQIDISEIFVNQIPMERSNVITLNVYLTMKWMDPRLKWDPSSYNEIDKVVIPSKTLWMPDLTLYTKSVKDFLKKSDYNSLVYSNGTVLFIPAIEIPMLFDGPLKTIASGQSTEARNKIGLWTMSTKDCNISSTATKISLSAFSWDMKFEKKVISSKYPCCPEEYQKVELVLTATRKASPERRLLAMPNLLFAILGPIFLFISPRKNSRILSIGLNILAILLYAHHASKTGGFIIPTGCLNGSLLINIIILVWSVISGLLWSLGSYSPHAASEVVSLKVLKTIFCLPDVTGVCKEGDKENQSSVATGSSLSSYQQISLLMDRVFAVFFLVVAIIFSIYHSSG